MEKILSADHRIVAGVSICCRKYALRGLRTGASFSETDRTGADSYWFPDATRYIGFNPDVPDKTIHEFPCYSFVLGDLHAHVVNIMFILLLLGLLYAWIKMVRKKDFVLGQPGTGEFWGKQLFMPQILMAAVLLGMFHWTNFWILLFTLW